MGKQITIKIDCKETTCGDCHFLALKHKTMEHYPFCCCYRKGLIVTRGNDFKRLQECIEAEGK